MTAPTDPPLTECPPWCQQPTGHAWEDEWVNGLIRYHTWRRSIESPCAGSDHIHHHEIGIDEIEQATTDGTARLRQVILDVEAPTEWSIDTALVGVAQLAEAVRIASTGLTDEHLHEVR